MRNTDNLSKLAYLKIQEKPRSGVTGFGRLHEAVKSRVEMEFPEADRRTRKAISHLIVEGILDRRTVNN